MTPLSCWWVSWYVCKLCLKKCSNYLSDNSCLLFIILSIIINSIACLPNPHHWKGKAVWRTSQRGNCIHKSQLQSQWSIPATCAIERERQENALVFSNSSKLAAVNIVINIPTNSPAVSSTLTLTGDFKTVKLCIAWLGGISQGMTWDKHMQAATDEFSCKESEAWEAMTMKVENTM